MNGIDMDTYLLCDTLRTLSEALGYIAGLIFCFTIGFFIGSIVREYVDQSDDKQDMKNRFFNILVPGVFLPMCLGTVYNFSQYSANIMQCFDISKFAADIGFTLIIFCLGFGAAIFGRMVELNPKRMAIVASILFVLGSLGLALATYTQCLPLYYLSCAIMGTGTGIGYVSPIKQLMSNFSDHKGLASGLAISGFGLGKFAQSEAVGKLGFDSIVFGEDQFIAEAFPVKWFERNRSSAGEDDISDVVTIIQAVPDFIHQSFAHFLDRFLNDGTDII